jgi:hypothetical protein
LRPPGYVSPAKAPDDCSKSTGDTSLKKNKCATMRSDQTYWCLLFIILILNGPLFAQSIMAADSGIGDSDRISWTVPPEGLTPLERASQGQMPSASSTSQKPEERPYGWDIAIYPALVWAPIFGVGITLPPSPSHPIASSANVSSSFNGA